MKQKKTPTEGADATRLYKTLRKQQSQKIGVELPSGAVAHISPDASPEDQPHIHFGGPKFKTRFTAKKVTRK